MWQTEPPTPDDVLEFGEHWWHRDKNESPSVIRLVALQRYDPKIGEVWCVSEYYAQKIPVTGEWHPCPVPQ